MDVNGLINGIMGQAGSGLDKAHQTMKSSGVPGGLVGGAAAGGLVALLLSNKKARKMGGKALKYGGMAAVGGLAYKAWRDHKESQNAPAQPTPQPAAQPAPAAVQIPDVPAGSAFDIGAQKDSQGSDIRLTLVRAMISSAKADGHIDAEEHGRIQEQIKAMELGAEEKAFLFDQLDAPSDPIAIARLSSGDEQAAEIYIASALAIDLDTPEERQYLDRLADALRLPADLRQRLDAEAGGVVNVAA